MFILLLLISISITIHLSRETWFFPFLAGLCGAVYAGHKVIGIMVFALVKAVKVTGRGFMSLARWSGGLRAPVRGPVGRSV